MMPSAVEGADRRDGAPGDLGKGASGVDIKIKNEHATENGTTTISGGGSGGSSSGGGTGAGGDRELALTIAKGAVVPPLPRITHGFQSLGNIMIRTVQDSYGKLAEVTESLQHERNDVASKKKLMKYVTDTRHQMIKVLVLAQWAKNADQVSDVIDLKAWLDQQRALYDHVMWDLFEVRRSLVNAKIPNPDLKTAVQILTTGEASKTIPYQHYVPPKPLANEQILEVLQEMNTLLSIRFALHDIPPQHFNNYSIHDGRATFTVASEFDVDLSIAKEDPQEQLYLLDFRLLFKPSLDEIPAGRLRQEVEFRGNEILRTKGLAGLYDFLHEFVLTHKISILRRQAHEMSMGKWTETLYITMIKRTLVIQYWVGKPGPKSWLEIGIKRADSSNSFSRLGVRWMRDAKEVKDAEIPFDVENLSTESLLKSVIALHTTYILSSIRENLSYLSIFPPPSLKLHISSSKASVSHLSVQLTPSKWLKTLIEPITGRFALQPPSAKVIFGETVMNSQPDPARKGHETIVKIRFTAMQDEIEMRAKSMGWEILRMINIRFTDLKRWFGSSAMYLMYMRRNSWADNWIIAVSLGVQGDHWWVVEIQEEARGWSIPDAQRIPISGAQNVSYQFLENLEKMVASFITLYTNTRRLTAMNVNHKLLSTRNPNASVVIPTLNINFQSLTKADWGSNNLRLSVHDLDKNGNITILVEGRMKDPVTRLSSADLSATNNDLAFHPRSGTFILRFNLPVGSIVMDAIVERLKRIERLITFISTVQKYRLPAKHVSLGQISFVYLKSHDLTADVNFSGEQEMKLTLDSRGSNPHRRILRFLNNLLNEKGLEAVVRTLRMTLPLLVALDAIEDASKEDELFVIARSSEWYRLEYPQKGYVLDIKLRMRRSSVWWFIKDAKLLHNNHVDSNLGFAGVEHQAIPQMRQLCMRSEDGVEGLKTGIAASMDSVGRLVRNIHRFLMGNLPQRPGQHQNHPAGAQAGRPMPS